MRHGIDFKTHSQCQRRGQIPLAGRNRISCFHPGEVAAGGASRDRTDDLKLAKLALSQLSYGPDPNGPNVRTDHGTLRWNGGPSRS